MYDKFTDLARKVMVVANEETMRFNHKRITPEHILLGLVKSDGVVSRIFSAMGIEPRKIRMEVEKAMKSGQELTVAGKLPLTDRAEQVIRYAACESEIQNLNYIGTEHLLLAIICTPLLTPGKILADLGMTVENVRNLVLGREGGLSMEKAEPSKAAIDTIPRLEVLRIIAAEFKSAASEIIDNQHKAGALRACSHLLAAFAGSPMPWHVKMEDPISNLQPAPSVAEPLKNTNEALRNNAAERTPLKWSQYGVDFYAGDFQINCPLSDREWEYKAIHRREGKTEYSNHSSLEAAKAWCESRREGK